LQAPGLLQRFLQALAALARGVAQALDRAAGYPRPAGGAAALDALAERFPGAPEHWLRVIAERAPQLAEADLDEAAVELPPIRPPRRLRLAWPGRRARAPRPLAFAADPGRHLAADESWPDLEAAVPARPEFGRARRAPPTPAVPPPAPSAKAARPQLRLVASRPEPRRPAASAHSDESRSARPLRDLATEPPARPRPTLTFAPRAAPRAAPLAAPTPTLAPSPPKPAPEPAWPSLDEPTQRVAWTGVPAHAPDPQRTWAAEPPRPEPAGVPAFSAAPPARASVDHWEPLAHPPAQRAAPTPAERPSAGERPAFIERQDPRWPPLPPADQDEIAEVSPPGVARHVREQEFGGWSG